MLSYYLRKILKMSEINLYKDVIGQSEIKKRFSKALLNYKLHHAYILTGSPGTGKEAFAIETIKIANCTEKSDKGYCGECRFCRDMNNLSSDDISFITPNIIKKSDSEKEINRKSKVFSEYLAEKGKMHGYLRSPDFSGSRFITIDQIKQIRSYSNYNSLSNAKKFVIINPAEAMNKESQNALLKILEEPPANFHFFLICENTSRLLPTIISRCQAINFSLLSDSEISEYLNRYEKELLLSEDELIENSSGSLETLRDLNTESGKEKLKIEKYIKAIFTDSKPPQTIELIDKAIAIIKEKLSETEFLTIINKVAGSLIRDELKENYTSNKINSMEKIAEYFNNFIHMWQRNINQRLLFINLYLNYKEEIKKWITK